MNNNMDNKRKYIEELKEKAAQVKEITGEYRKRRPLVIEFSGAPKSGKTSSINSLMQFLKINDFKVKVLQESASICPVKDKHSPMFNVWTACDSIRSLIGELESDRMQHDVIIIDRGIFDAMCWFQWLLNQKKMDHKMKEIMDQFLSMRELISYIDIVFIYKARPDVSIEREYASLLTDVSGSIMNETVLKEYLKAIEDTEKYLRDKNWFREMHTIDTSDKDQNDIGKEVTETALRILKELFEEQIGYISLSDQMIEQFRENPWMAYSRYEELGGMEQKLMFGQRSVLEEDDRYVQPIPIVVIREETTGYVLAVRKAPKATREDSREKDKTLPYVGGHIRREDTNCCEDDGFLEICKAALKREVREELGISITLDGLLPDIIYVRDASRSDLHMAVCFVIEVKEETLKVRMESGELKMNRGKGKSGRFVDPYSIYNEGNSWAEVILKKYFRVGTGQLSMFDNEE